MALSEHIQTQTMAWFQRSQALIPPQEPRWMIADEAQQARSRSSRGSGEHGSVRRMQHCQPRLNHIGSTYGAWFQVIGHHAPMQPIHFHANKSASLNGCAFIVQHVMSINWRPWNLLSCVHGSTQSSTLYHRASRPSHGNYPVYQRAIHWRKTLNSRAGL